MFNLVEELATITIVFSFRNYEQGANDDECFQISNGKGRF